MFIRLILRKKCYVFWVDNQDKYFVKIYGTLKRKHIIDIEKVLDS